MKRRAELSLLLVSVFACNSGGPAAPVAVESSPSAGAPAGSAEAEPAPAEAEPAAAEPAEAEPAAAPLAAPSEPVEVTATPSPEPAPPTAPPSTLPEVTPEEERCDVGIWDPTAKECRYPPDYPGMAWAGCSMASEPQGGPCFTGTRWSRGECACVCKGKKKWSAERRRCL